MVELFLFSLCCLWWSYFVLNAGAFLASNATDGMRPAFVSLLTDLGVLVEMGSCLLIRPLGLRGEISVPWALEVYWMELWEICAGGFQGLMEMCFVLVVRS